MDSVVPEGWALRNMCKEKKSLSVKAWELIDMSRHAKGMRLSDLGVLVGVSTNTVCLDSGDPDRIPQRRLWAYMQAVGMSADTIMDTLYKEFLHSTLD